MNKKAEIVIDTTVDQSESINIEEIIKQRSIFGPLTCCATMSKLNNIRERAQYSYGKIDIGMSIYTIDIAAAGGIAEIQKGIKNCANMEKKIKYMMVKTGKVREEIVEGNLKSGTVQKTETYQHLGITINKDGNLEKHIKVIARKCEAISRDLSNNCSDIWNGSMGKYKISGDERNREDTRKGAKKIFQL